MPLRLPFLILKTDVFKLEDHRQFLSLWIRVELSNLWRCTPGLSYCQEIFVTKGGLVHLLEIGMEHRTVIDYFLIRNFPNHVNDIHTETTNTFINPEVHHLVNFLAKFFIFPVEIGLFLTEKVEIVLTRLFIVFPGGSTKDRLQIIGLIPPDIVVTLRAIRILTSLDKPGVFIRGMIDYQVHDNSNITLLSFCDEFIHVLHGSENSCNRLIISNIITIIIHRTIINRRKPNRCDS